MTDLEKAKQYRIANSKRVGPGYIVGYVTTSECERLLAAYASHSNAELRDEIANLRAEDDGDLRIHDKLRLAENVIQTWTTRAETAEHANSELLERVRELALAALGWLSTSECHHKDDATCPSRQRLKAEIEKSLGPAGIITQIDVAKAPETRNV